MDWIGLRLSISDLVRRFGSLRGRCAGGFLGIQRFRGGAVVGGNATGGPVVDWIGFRPSSPDSVRDLGVPGGYLAETDCRATSRTLVFCGFVGVLWLVARCWWTSVWAGSDVVV